jgi:hypothetical protein
MQGKPNCEDSQAGQKKKKIDIRASLQKAYGCLAIQSHYAAAPTSILAAVKSLL